MKKLVLLFLVLCGAVPCVAQYWEISYNVSLDPTSSSLRCPALTIPNGPLESYYLDGTPSGKFPAKGTTTVTAEGRLQRKCCADTYPPSGCLWLSTSATITKISPSNGCSATYTNGGASITFTRLPMPEPVTSLSSGTAGVDCNKYVTCSIDPLSSVNFQWQYSESMSGPWYNFGTNSATVTATANDLYNPALSGKYTMRFVRVIDPNCTSIASPPSTRGFQFSVDPPTATFTSTDPLCNGGKDGSIRVDIISADPLVVNDFNIQLTSDLSPIDNLGVITVTNGFSYIITKSDILNPDHGMKATNYYIEVQNNSGGLTGSCKSKKSDPILLKNPDPVTVPSFAVSTYNGYNVKCKGDTNGTLQALPAGGTGSYSQYVWTPDVGTTQTVSGLSAKTYTVKVKDSNGCWSGDYSKELKEPDLLKVSLTSTGGSGGYNVTCHDKTDGQLTATPGGGAGGYSYSWTGGRSGNPVSSLGTGGYTVTLTDGNGCVATDSKTLTAPLPIDFSINQLSVLTCPGDMTASFQAQNVINTIGTINYAWSTGENTSTISDKGAGTYTATVSDGQGCSTSKSVSIANPPAYTVNIAATTNYNGSVIKCNGESNGSIKATVRDHLNAIVPASYYSWKKNSAPFEEGVAKDQITNLGEGTYTTEITYNGICKATSNPLFLNDPDPITVDVTAISNYHGAVISCAGESDGSLQASVSGGTGNPLYTYHWDSGENTSIINGKPEGTYQVTAKDRNDCEGTGVLTINEPAPVDITVNSLSDYHGFNVSCNGIADGFINTTASGGTGAITYAWSNGKTTPSVNSLAAGTYSLTAKDANSCPALLVQILTSPTLLQPSIASKQDVACAGGNDGKIALQAIGGAGGYQYSKDNGVSWQALPDFNTLTKGVYSLRVKDVNSCFKNLSETLTEPSPLSISFSDIEPAFCAEARGKATGIVTGGVADYAFTWKNSTNETVNTSSILSNVKAGIYTLNITDAHHCPLQKSVAITSTDGAKTTFTSLDALCFDSADGAALISITAGDGPFVVKWPDNQNTLQGHNLKRGIYPVLITDVHNCTVVQEVEVKSPEALQLNLKNLTIPTCNGICDGAMELEANGGLGSYSFSWNGKTAAAQNSLCAGNYPVVLVDGNGCKLEKSFTLSQPETLTVKNVNRILPTCADGCDGSIEVTGEGGNGMYSYSWDNSTTSAIRLNTCPGTYSVTVKDQKGCTVKNEFTLANTPPLVLNLGDDVTLCVGQSYILNAGSSWASVKWTGDNNFTASTSSVTIKEAGQYKAEVISDKGCKAEDVFVLRTSRDLLKAKFFLTTEAHVGDTIVMVDVSWPLPEGISWSYPVAMNKIIDTGTSVYGQFDAPGIYDIELQARLGECRDKMVKRITILNKTTSLAGGRLGYEAFVEQFEIFPNPGSGHFDVSVLLAEESDVVLSVWSSTESKLIRTIRMSGSKAYREHIDLRPLSAGGYVLRLDHAKGKEYLRFVVE